jgi:uncharacterized membrane protein YeaQ/YmgE (transglycosylase-associated protein family)
MGILAWIVFGFVVGLVARALLPGDQKMGIVWTTLLGISGSFIGGTAGNLLLGRDAWALGSAGFVGSVIGAITLLAIYGLVYGRRRRRAVV